jgi:hypothetical protein
MQDKLIPLCKLYESVSKTSGKRYFVGTLSFTSKLLVFSNEDAKEGEPQWTVFIAGAEAGDLAGPGRRHSRSGLVEQEASGMTATVSAHCWQTGDEGWQHDHGSM